MRIRNRVFCGLVCGLMFFVIGCASVSGPTVIKTYDQVSPRSQIAILRVKGEGLRVIGLDGQTVPSGAQYVLLQPGRHQVWFTMWGQTILTTYRMTNKKYLDARPGRTYILKAEGGGLFADRGFPDAVDVTGDPKLHVPNIPQEIEKR